MTANRTLIELWNEGRTALTEIESKQFLGLAGMPVVVTKLARTKKEAIRYSREIGFSVAMKIISPDIIHKSDSGGVKLNLRSVADVEQAYDEIMRRGKEGHPTAQIQGVSVEEMAPPGREIIIGMSKDPQFGPLLMFGVGGIMVEILKDVSFRLVPLSPRDAHEMIKEIKAYSLLTGFRGSEAVDISYLERLLLEVSDLVESHPEIKELDLNPVIAYTNGALVVDSRIILEDRI